MSGHYVLAEVDIFDNEADAIARSAEKSREYVENENARQEQRKQWGHRSYTWAVGYHRREAKRSRRELEHHESRAVECKALAKPRKPQQEDTGDD